MIYSKYPSAHKPSKNDKLVFSPPRFADDMDLVCAASSIWITSDNEFIIMFKSSKSYPNILDTHLHQVELRNTH